MKLMTWPCEYNTHLANYYDSQLPAKGIDLFMTDLTV